MGEEVGKRERKRKKEKKKNKTGLIYPNSEGEYPWERR